MSAPPNRLQLYKQPKASDVNNAKVQLNSELATIDSNYFLSNRRLQR